jgi:hypothetical protein
VTRVRAFLAFDPALRCLSVIDDHDAVARRLAPGVESAEVRRQDTKYEPGVRCVAAYEVRPRGTGSPAPLLGALVVTPEGVESFRADCDPALPRLPQALDGLTVGKRLAEALPAAEGSTCVAVPVRYKPGTRCVIRYEIGDSGRPAVCYGKLLADGSDLQASLVSGLSRALADVADAPLVPPLLAHWPDLGLLVHPAVDRAVELHRVVSDRTTPSQVRRSALQRAGAALAALHACTLPSAPGHTFGEDLRELRNYGRVLAFVDPALGARYSAVVERLEEGEEGSADLTVVSHGAFRTDQLLLTDERLLLIDLDTVCRAEPARDIGNLLAYLDWKAVRQPHLAGALEAARAAFLDGYARRRRAPAPARVSLYRAASLVKIAGRRFRSLTAAEWPLVPALLNAAAGLATEGQRGLA